MVRDGLYPYDGEMRLAFLLLLSASAVAQDAPPRFLGARGCRDCHATASIGDQYGIWRRSAHARAFETLRTEAARRIARSLEIEDPSTDARCVKCHVTAWDAPPERKVYGFRAADGVSCESCHGPGEGYAPREVMIDPEESRRQGLLVPDRDACVRCHNAESPTYRPFDYEKALAAIAHPVPERFEWDRAIAWERDYEAGLARAQREDRPMLVDFHPGVGCPRCDEMKAVYEAAEVVDAARGFVCVRVEAPTKSQLLRHGLSDCATRVMFPDGRIAKDLYGAVPPGLLAHVLRRVEQARMGFPLDDADPKAAEAREVWELIKTQGPRMIDYVARRCVEIGRACEPLLLTEIWNPDSPLRIGCLSILGHVEGAERRGGRAIDPSPGVDPFWDLLAFAYDPVTDLRATAVEGLARIGDPRAGVPLARYATNDVDPRVVTASFRALAAARDPASIPWLVQRAFEVHCNNPRCPVPIDAVVAIGAIGDPAATEGLVACLEERPDLAPAVLCALADVRSPRAAEIALRVLDDRAQSFAARNEAVFTVARSRDERAWAAMLANLADPNVEIRAGICEATGELAIAAGIDPMRRVVDTDPHEVPRAYAAWALGRCAAQVPERKGEVAERLVTLLEDPSPLVRVQTLRALVGLGRDDLAFLLRDALTDNSSWRVEDRKSLTLAAETLAERKDMLAVPLLVGLLDERDLDTSRVAAACLERFTGEALGHPGEVPLHLPRVIFGGAGSEVIRLERRRILDVVRLLIPKWRAWAEGHAWAPRPIEADVSAARRVVGEGPARESHLWIRVKVDAPVLRIGIRAKDAAQPVLDRVVIAGSVVQTPHGEGWEARALPSPHRADGALWFRWTGALRMGVEDARPLLVRIATDRGTAEIEVPP